MAGVPDAWHLRVSRTSCRHSSPHRSKPASTPSRCSIQVARSTRDYREFILPHTRRIFESPRHDAGDSFRGRDRAILGELAKPAATSSAPTGAHRSTRYGNALASIERFRQSRSDVAARSSRSRCGHRRCPGAGRGTCRAHFQPRAWILPSTPVERASLARYVHQQTRTA